MIGWLIGRWQTALAWAAFAAAVVLAIFRAGVRRERDRAEARDLRGALDVHHRVDEALRRHDGDTRPVDERLRAKGRLRDVPRDL